MHFYASITNLLKHLQKAQETFAFCRKLCQGGGRLSIWANCGIWVHLGHLGQWEVGDKKWVDDHVMGSHKREKSQELASELLFYHFVILTEFLKNN